MAELKGQLIRELLESPHGALALEQYALHSNILLLAIFDTDWKLQICNQKMCLGFHLGDDATIDIATIFDIDDPSTLPVNEPDSVPTPKLLQRRENATQYVCYFFHLNDRILMIGESAEIADEQLAENMSFMTVELTTLMRELRQKNTELKAANAKIQELVNTDPLTGLYNRRYLKEQLDFEFSRATRHGIPLSVVICDLDLFKQVNDTFGHDAGDTVLTSFSKLLQENTREEDLCARYGGEEFVIVMPHITMEEALLACERIRELYAASDPLGNGHRVSASFGITSKDGERSADHLLTLADKALYLAKKSGRNRVIYFDPKTTEPITYDI